MNERQRRLGVNEVLFREVNERIERVSQTLEVTNERLAILCECGDESCTERVEVPLADYERIRGDGALFLIRPGHETLDVEDVVEETPAFHVVRKKNGGPAELAREHDPRSD
jgi:hypothetical protein